MIALVRSRSLGAIGLFVLATFGLRVEAQGPTAPAPLTPATPRPGPTSAAPWEGAVDVVPAPDFLDTRGPRAPDDRPRPTADQVRALRQMEAEVERYAESASAYRETVFSVLRREYQRQRRAQTQWYNAEVRKEEKLLDETRDNAIRLFERFVQAYPDDAAYTPDAMFRLGELYFERSAIEYQARYERSRDEEGESAPLVADFSPTILLYEQLAERFPNYRRIDGVYYLIGYCHHEMGALERAQLAWLHLVCASEFTYRPAPPPVDGADASDEPMPHPALTLDGERPVDPKEPFVDRYQNCTPVSDEARFLSETWFRIGEYHFDDYGDPHSIERAIRAYGKILVDPEDRNYNLALYKVAWAYYRASRYPEAIKHFGMLVDWSDAEEARTGRAGSELRPEAIQYLGIAFAYDDWNENQVPDVQEGMPTPLARVQDPNLLPQDRRWTPEVYFQLGHILFDEAKYPDAIAAWRLALARWPLHPNAPEITNMIARAHQRHNEFEAAIATRGELGGYGEGSEWWNANVDHPTEQRRAEELAETALIQTAVHHHQQAQEQRRLCVSQRNPALCQRAEENYAHAAKAYRDYLSRYPNNPQAYELRYNLADTLYWSGNYEEAASEYAAVRDSNLDDVHFSESARRVVESLQRIVEREAKEGRLAVRDDAPPTQGAPPRVFPVAMPTLLQRLAQGRETYLARVPEERDTEKVRDAYDFNNALLLYQYGYWDHARERFARIFEERCKGALANETGRVAWYNLNNMAVAMQDTAEVERLSRAVQERACTFTADASAPSQVDCDKPQAKDDPRCVAQAQLTNIRFQRAVNTFREAERVAGEKQRALYERSAGMLLEAVEQEPGHSEAPKALEMAAIALERTSRFESAARLYQRIVDEVGPRQGENEAEKRQLDAILSNAYFRLAYNANRFFEFERAVESYRMLADSRRFASSTEPAVKERRDDALINAALILDHLQQYDRAAAYYKRAAETVADPDVRRRAHYALAETAFKRKLWSESLRQLRDFIGRYERDPSAGELVVQAYFRIAQVRKQLGQEREHEKALSDVVAAFSRSGQGAGSMAAEYAAHARFLLVDEGMQQFEKFAIEPGRPSSLEQYVQAITTQIDVGSREAKRRAEAYAVVPEYRRPTWTIASLVRQGRVYEVLARAVLNTPFVMPTDLSRQLRRAGAEAREDIRMQVEDRVRQTLDERVRPIECLAVARYALAARAARAGSIDNEHTRVATDRLQAYGDERIAECIAEAQREMANLEPYRPGEFARAPRGRHLELEVGAGPPSLTGGGR